MTWSYGGDPSASDLDKARFLCGDTDSNQPLLSNEEIQYLITLRGNPTRAAQDACAAIMSTLARIVDYSIGQEKVVASQRFKQYKANMENLRALWIATNAAPSWAGATSSSGSSDPIFNLGIHDDNRGR